MQVIRVSVLEHSMQNHLEPSVLGASASFLLFFIYYNPIPGQDIESIAMKFKKSYVEELEKNKNLREDVINKKTRIKGMRHAAS